jgi:hypothetical protein
VSSRQVVLLATTNKNHAHFSRSVPRFTVTKSHQVVFYTTYYPSVILILIYKSMNSILDSTRRTVSLVSLNEEQAVMTLTPQPPSAPLTVNLTWQQEAPRLEPHRTVMMSLQNRSQRIYCCQISIRRKEITACVHEALFTVIMNY